ncbi:hypothetical protein ACTHTT_10470 [Neisseria sp. P0021.S002]|uniref:hypothetical protein n=1 Tax=Neisseria sp. P0021.S002 TaxID=3436817 RepID=UPI003F817248
METSKEKTFGLAGRKVERGGEVRPLARAAKSKEGGVWKTGSGGGGGAEEWRGANDGV